MKRRDFITMLGGAAAAAAVLSSLATRTQTPAIIGMIPRQFARAFGNDRFQGLEPYPSIAALDEIVDHSRSCVPRIGRLA